MAFPRFTWPDWKDAPSGTRFKHNRTGRLGTLVGPAKNAHNGAIVVWDDRPFPVRSVDGEEGHVNFVGIARDASPLDPSATVGPMDASEWREIRRGTHRQGLA
jgi:hypothetical protein